MRPKVRDYLGGMAIDLSHQIDLLPFFLLIGLVDCNLVDLESLGANTGCTPEIFQDAVEIRSHRNISARSVLFVNHDDLIWCVRTSPYVRQGDVFGLR